MSADTAPNGAGMELDLFGGYKYDAGGDLKLSLELRSTLYPGAYANLPTRDKYNMLELIPGLTYKYFSVNVYYCLWEFSGVNEHFALAFNPPLKPNGSSKGSTYVEGNFNYPLIENTLTFRLTAGHQYVRHYGKLNYSLLGTGLTYKSPDSWGGLAFSVNGSVTNANKSLNTNTNSAGKTLVISRPRIWVGVTKAW